MKIRRSLFCFLIIMAAFISKVAADEPEAIAEQKPAEAVKEQVKKESIPVPVIPKHTRKYYMKIITRDVLTEEDCKVLSDLNQSIALIEKFYKERKYGRATKMLDILFEDIAKVKKEANKRIDQYLIEGKTKKDFQIISRTISRRRYPGTCSYHHLQNIENDALVYQRDVKKAIFKQESKLRDKEREQKMREHIKVALELLEKKQYYIGRYELKLALELCDDRETAKVIKQRIQEVEKTIKYEKRQRALNR